MAVVTLLAQIEVNLPLSFLTSRSDLIYLRLEGDLLKIELGALRQTDRQTGAEAAAATALSFVRFALPQCSVGPSPNAQLPHSTQDENFPATRSEGESTSKQLLFPLRRMINMFAKRTQEVSKQSD